MSSVLNTLQSHKQRCDEVKHPDTFLKLLLSLLYFILFTGAASEPYVTTLDETKDWAVLQCVVRGVSPKPKVE